VCADIWSLSAGFLKVLKKIQRRLGDDPFDGGTDVASASFHTTVSAYLGATTGVRSMQQLGVPPLAGPFRHCPICAPVPALMPATAAATADGAGIGTAELEPAEGRRLPRTSYPTTFPMHDAAPEAPPSLARIRRRLRRAATASGAAPTA
jgi:hypothetical protein